MITLSTDMLQTFMVGGRNSLIRLETMLILRDQNTRYGIASVFESTWMKMLHFSTSIMYFNKLTEFGAWAFG